MRANPCGKHGKCEDLSFDGSDAYQCHCHDGWNGEHCDNGKIYSSFKLLKIQIQRSIIVRQTHVLTGPSVSMGTIIMNVDVSPVLMGPSVDTVSILIAFPKI